MFSFLLLLALAQQPQKGVIEVNVHDSVSGQPIPGAEITFIFFQTPPPNIVTRATTDETGRAVFSDLALGRYSVSASRDGYINPVAFGTNVTIDAQSPRHSTDLTLSRGAAINGHVLDSKGRPLAQAQVQVLRQAYRDGRRILLRPLNSRAETDDRGQYRLIGLGPGDYFLQAELRATPTAAQDKYPRVIYYPGTVDVSSAAPIKVTSPIELAGIDINIPNTPAFTISGKVINAVPGGRLLPNGQHQRTVASFFLGPRDATSVEEPILVVNREYVSGGNDLDETPFELPGFAPGSYYLYPLVDGEGTTFTTRRTAVEVNDKNIEGLTITVSTPPDLKGKVVVNGDAAAIRMEQLRLAPRWKENLPSLVTIRTSAQTVDPTTGEFTLKGLPESSFTPAINGLPPDAYIEDLRQGSRNVYADGIVNVGADSAEPIEITINSKGGTIRGTAQDASQKAVPAAGVVLVPEILRRGNSLLYKRVTADTSGRFTLRGVAPGAYKLFAWPALPEGSAEENAAFMAPLEALGTAVQVEGAGTMNVDVPVIPQ